MRRNYRDGHGYRSFHLYAQFLAVVVGREKAVNLGGGRHFVLFFYQTEPLEFGLDAVFDAGPAVVLNMNVVGRDESSGAVIDDSSNAGEDGAIGHALVADGEHHGAIGGKMALIGRLHDVLLHATEA